ncbi:helix-turn-helix domain-containing protein [Streptomyces sp. NPDC059352]|uniref:helix-turn-helix domain-containing protein n=1 Tax=Streptomyces sp. NPDC059352 TaxID=3346810 RepID=UPI0036961881
MSRHASAAQRHRAMREVLAGRPVGEVARRHGVSRQTLYAWRKRYAAHGEGGLEDRSRRPHRSPARIAPAVEALICSLREQHPEWGAGRLRDALERLGIAVPPSRTTIHRVLVRNRLLVRAPVNGDEELSALITAARETLDRLRAALGGLDEPEPREAPAPRPAAHTDEEAGAGASGPAGEPCGACALCAPPVRLFERPAPASTISWYGRVIPAPRDVGRTAVPLTESARCGSAD